MDRNVKYLIIGAGISGLTFANYAKGDYLIIEKEDEVGGYCRTIKKKDYVWDYAGHFFHFSTEEFKKKFLDSVDRTRLSTRIRIQRLCIRKTDRLSVPDEYSSA